MVRAALRDKERESFVLAFRCGAPPILVSSGREPVRAGYNDRHNQLTVVETRSHDAGREIRRADQSPGSIGIQKLRPRKIRVADKAADTSIPIRWRVATDVAS